MPEREKPIEEEAEEAKRQVLDDIERMLDTYPDAPDDDTGPLDEYGLGFDYVPSGTFRDQREGYWRFQIAWGGPSYEIRYFGPGRGFQPVGISFVYLDWFTGYEIPLEGHDREVAQRLWDEYLEPFAEETFHRDIVG